MASGKVVTMSSAAAAEHVVNSDNLTALSVMQEINLLRQEELFIDIHIEVCGPFAECLIMLPTAVIAR